MKILFCTSTSSHIKNFHLPYINALSEAGNEIFVASGDSCYIIPNVKNVTLPFCKSITSPKNIKAIFAAKKLLLKEKFDIISLHTTLAAAVVRAAVLLLPKSLRPHVIYTCHGYLFNEGDGLSRHKYLIPERIVSSVTNTLFVMNNEDLSTAIHYGLSNDIRFINGIGINTEKFSTASDVDKSQLREKWGFSKEDFLFVYAAEFSHRKNQKMLIESFAKVQKHMPNAKLILAGDGALFKECKALVVALCNSESVLLPGFLDNVNELYSISNCCVTTSAIEGLPFNVLEAILSDLLVLGSDIKGHRELANCSENMVLFNNQWELSSLLLKAYYGEMHKGSSNLERFSINSVLPVVLSAYNINQGGK